MTDYHMRPDNPVWQHHQKHCQKVGHCNCFLAGTSGEPKCPYCKSKFMTSWFKHLKEFHPEQITDKDEVILV